MKGDEINAKNYCDYLMRVIIFGKDSKTRKHV